jgi:RHS repeat-associated protein
VRFLTNASGTITDTYTFDAFGMLIASTGTTPNPYLYSGGRFDSNLSLYHLRARYYNPLTGRFETMDPYVGNIANPVTLNKYTYALGDPVNQVDPSGRDVFERAVLEETNEFTTTLKLQRALAVEECVDNAALAIRIFWGFDIRGLPILEYGDVLETLYARCSGAAYGGIN